MKAGGTQVLPRGQQPTLSAVHEMGPTPSHQTGGVVLPMDLTQPGLQSLLRRAYQPLLGGLGNGQGGIKSK